jgi:16S rRNA (adenine1518-N6/adenine1519-N6)-dimethyltransferase
MSRAQGSGLRAQGSGLRAQGAGLRAKKKYGQHFLQAAWADKLVAAIEPRRDERFIEIGPGPGALTLRLAPLAGEVTAVEVDLAMVDALRSKLPGNVTLVHADFLDVDVASITHGHPSRVVGNLPYNVSTPILFRLLDVYRATGTLVDATLMLQREVADRITAAPGTGEYGVLSISAQMHADVRRVLTLPPGAFRPPPKVHSAVVHFRFRPPAVALANGRVFESMVRSIFTQRRKTLRNALGAFATSHHRDAAAALASAGIDPRRRPETLQLTELARLADYFVSP